MDGCKLFAAQNLLCEIVETQNGGLEIITNELVDLGIHDPEIRRSDAAAVIGKILDISNVRDPLTRAHIMLYLYLKRNRL